MKLDRNLNADGRGKYGLILNRRIAEIGRDHGTADGTAGAAVAQALKVLQSFGVLDWGTTPETEFFVMRLKDAHAGPAMEAYAQSCYDHGRDPDYTVDVKGLAMRSGLRHPRCKVPD